MIIDTFWKVCSYPSVAFWDEEDSDWNYLKDLVLVRRKREKTFERKECFRLNFSGNVSNKIIH